MALTSMLLRPLRRALIAGFAAAALAAGAAAQSGPFTIQVDGSSTVFPIAETAASEFQQRVAGRIRVAVGLSGTGGGFRKFCRGEIQIATASRPILANEMAICRGRGIGYIEVPVAFDALAVVVHPDSPVQDITIEKLKEMWQPTASGRVTNWSQVGLHDRRLTLYGPGTSSGTFDYFTEAVMGRAKSSRSDYNQSENDNVLVQGVAGDIGALGYFGMAYYIRNRGQVRALAIREREGAPAVYPTAEAVTNGTYRPLSRPLFIYVSTNGLRRREVADFVTYWLENGARLATARDYVGLPAPVYQAVLRRVRNRQVGTAFAGQQDVGGTIQELMARPLVTQAAPR